MKIKRIWQIYFSATGTTEKIIKTIAGEIAAETGAEILTYDFTLPAARETFPKLGPDDMVVFGLPTYAGRLPNLMLPYLQSISGGGALAVPVVTFGNRAFDNSLIELRNILEYHGFHTIAGGAFSCEHSFSHILGAGRPDADDIKDASDFGRNVAAKLCEISEHQLPPPVLVDGDSEAGYYQPRDRKGTFIDIRKVKPMTNDKCIKCGLCARTCPMGAIDHENVYNVPGKCIKCCSCYKKCPVGAKYFENPDFIYHKEELETMYGDRRALNKTFF